MYRYFFFFNDTATTEIYTLSLHDALPISHVLRGGEFLAVSVGDVELAVGAEGDAVAIMAAAGQFGGLPPDHRQDRKSTRLNSSHANISYAVFCLKKKKSFYAY